MSGKSTPLLSWTHFRILLQVKDKKACAWYEREAITQSWGVRTLQRNISLQYYYCMLQTRKQELVKNEMQELGKGYAFVARQQHIHTEKKDYFIDLVFYNYILKCFVLIDLKTKVITHQDVGQMDMCDELKRSEGDNPTIGIVLCLDTDEDVARYSVLHGDEQLSSSQYRLYLLTEEELRAAIILPFW